MMAGAGKHGLPVIAMHPASRGLAVVFGTRAPVLRCQPLDLQQPSSMRLDRDGPPGRTARAGVTTGVRRVRVQRKHSGCHRAAIMSGTPVTHADRRDLQPWGWAATGSLSHGLKRARD